MTRNCSGITRCNIFYRFEIHVKLILLEKNLYFLTLLLKIQIFQLRKKELREKSNYIHLINYVNHQLYHLILNSD